MRRKMKMHEGSKSVHLDRIRDRISLKESKTENRIRNMAIEENTGSRGFLTPKLNHGNREKSKGHPRKAQERVRRAQGNLGISRFGFLSAVFKTAL